MNDSSSKIIIITMTITSPSGITDLTKVESKFEKKAQCMNL